MKKYIHGWKIKQRMMKVENDDIFLCKKIIRRDFIVMNKMASKDKTFSKIEKLRITLFIVHDVNELFICIKSTSNKCKELPVTIVQINDLLHELIAFGVKDD